MSGRASHEESESSGNDRADHLCAVIQRELPALRRSIGALVYRLCGRLRREEAEDRIEEILDETVKRALQAADRYDPQRSAMAWLMGFPLRILQERRRGRKRRPVVESDLGDVAWRNILEDLCAVDSDAAAIRLDIRQAMARLKEEQRRILELRFFDGLDGEAFAQAVGASTVGAARTRLARALQALRAQFDLAEGEVTP